MLFRVVARFDRVHIYTLRGSPEGALELAEDRRKLGADSVWVCDQNWQFISASELDARVRKRAESSGPSTSSPRSDGPSVKVQSGPDPVKPTVDDGGGTPRRVRVFKAMKHQDDRS
ncbi:MULTISPECIES: hypothetical protein [Methylobacterium]|uniref:hypothetical protein n=1 Tax=Methylobacterium TaxID=407 RepID=UPI0013ED386F|nr:hypothetical protein [Methylobacterium sp. DB0501]NGM38678.1 hypothetical protein [Methylobacterium sp. DB0501]